MNKAKKRQQQKQQNGSLDCVAAIIHNTLQEQQMSAKLSKEDSGWRVCTYSNWELFLNAPRWKKYILPDSE